MFVNLGSGLDLGIPPISLRYYFAQSSIGPRSVLPFGTHLGNIQRYTPIRAYIIPLCTTLQYNHNIYDTIVPTIGRNEILNTKNNEFNSAAMFPVWHELPKLLRVQINLAGIVYVDGRKFENS